ncbi:RHS repeat-associated protein [Nitrosomonas nitrosa]|uniref:SpvB/TcaC N-terminal domain-containing protein n=1 Tax=Nitrosomonas nitrosa TaxID=52442 RepID=UPI000D323E88|nr:SpvB/TcaC N-terminal domain-containing protein [Nitrosomonas nitrosa]PTQ91464.1 RHS repeat-associated protein [Nitrosomonas nitrosa]
MRQQVNQAETQTRTEGQSTEKQSFSQSAPTITLPKGGGAIRGMGEKFAANPVTGTGSMSVPIATSPGRAGFGPQLSLSYDSGAGNGPFGFGWSLSLASITRKTDKGLPQYQDSEESDVFILSGAEDLVPEFEKDDDGAWTIKNGKHVLYEKLRTVGGKTYHVRRYRPRIEGLFARIERWTNQTNSEDTFWRSISKDNITTWYGKTAESRITDPLNASRIFSWLICESYDDKGNVIVYHYLSENSDDVDLSQANELNRTDDTRSTNRYLKRIRYGNHIPYLPVLSDNNPWPKPPSDEDSDASKDWCFEVVFDYGEHDEDNPLPREADKLWKARNDSFSSYRAGFEVRTYRLCQRVLMFHHFSPLDAADPYGPDAEAVGSNCLVRSTDFFYSYEKNKDDPRNPVYSFLLTATQKGYKRKLGGYLSRSLPLLEFEYIQPIIDEGVREIDLESLENLPYGLDGKNYQWVDLDGEGLSGILTEQGNNWYYKRNHSANNVAIDTATKIERAAARFSPIELVASKPNTQLANQAQFIDLAGDGQTDLVEMEGPIRGFYERTDDQGWVPFQPFISWPNVDTRDPNLKFIDLTGDGHADILISEDQAFIWHASLAEAGYGPAQRVQQQFDEEKGPRLVFADSEQSIFLADLSGDGLTDIARIRNGEVCYWPNLGYCRFGAKVTMDNSPWFDASDQFDPRRIRLADIDGTGTTDILYLHGKGVHIYFNQSGNSWSSQNELPNFPAMDNLAFIQALDLLGNGTACLVWSSPLPSYARSPMRYIDLMSGQKPHLLISVKNNLGAVTTVQYAPSTKFYLQDKEEGRPWITKLPFPVHVVEKVTVTDKWRETRFSSTYSYHHGYFDGTEREFRGFGRIEQIDVESYGKFKEGNTDSPYITPDKTLYQPPVKTITWYHTGAFLDQERIISQYEHEYFFNRLKEKYPTLNIPFQENPLPQPDLEAENLTAEEWREALRACKGMMLRQEVIELDIDALEDLNHPEQIPVKLFSTAYHNCHIRRLQPRAENRYALFLVAESEVITYHYELDVREEQLNQQNQLIPDPRIAHTLNLRYDEYANILQSVAVVYPRIGQFEDGTLKEAERTLIHNVQRERHLAYTETRYTKDFGIEPEEADHYRLRLPCEVLTYELTIPDSRDNSFFTVEELRKLNLSEAYKPDGKPNEIIDVAEIAYQNNSDRKRYQKRQVEHVRTLFFKGDLINPLPFGEHGRLGLVYEAYKLALTDTLLDAVFKDAENGKNKLDEAVKGTETARDILHDAKISGYLSGAALSNRFSDLNNTGQYWIRSGIAGFSADAAQHFYLPERYTDPFDNTTTLEYDRRDLFIASSTDALQNKTEVKRFDFRVLAPREMKDINANLSEVYFDALGLPTAMAVKGKGTEGDNFTGFNDTLANPSLNTLTAFFAEEKPYDETQTHEWLGNTTVRHVYYFGETEEKLPDGASITHWEQHPACACGILREQHISQLAAGEQSALQVAFEYSDGMGSVVVKKIQAEPEDAGQPLRWIASGKTVLNNKGKPVKQYEPYFSNPAIGHRFDAEEAAQEIGVTSLMYYDAVGRLIRTEMPDGSNSHVEFSPWHVRTFDQNDTVIESKWYSDRNPPDPDQPLPRNAITGELSVTPDQRAAWLAAQHRNTPAFTILDSLGREVISIAHNRYKDTTGALKDEKYLTFTKLDAEGKPLWIRDARNNLVMQYIVPAVPNNQSADPVKFAPCYGIAGNLLFQHSMDAGNRWMLNDAAGKPMLAWDNRGHTFRTDYDALLRPVGSFVKGTDPDDPDKIIQFEKIIYGDMPENGLTDAQKIQLNLHGKPYQHYDTAGLVVSMGRNSVAGKDEAFDFKGNLLRSTRQLIKDYKSSPDWSQNPALEVEIFTSSTRYDALNRPIQIIAPHSNQPNTKLNIIRPSYNEAGLLECMDVWLEQANEPASLLDANTATRHIVTDIDYNAKGQRELIAYGNGVKTAYEYDKLTFRLSHLETLRGAEALQDLFYTYDPIGNITQIRDEAQDTIFHNGNCVNPGAEYRYDALYRLIAASGREHKGGDQQTDWDNSLRIVTTIPNDCQALRNYVEIYRYDAVGNILQMLHHQGRNLDQPGQTIWNRRYQYAFDSNRLFATRLPNDPDNLSDYTNVPGYGAKYSYDQHGNMTSMPHLPSMEWDFKNQLYNSRRLVTNDGLSGEKTFYVYDAAGQRVRKVTETQNSMRKDECIYLGGFEVYRQYNGNGQTVTLERETLHVMDDKQRVALIETRTLPPGNDPAPRQLVRFQFGNHLGSSVLELTDQAQVISYEEYHPYGTTAYQAARNQTDTPKRYRYTGKERDEETGFSYHGARYYAGWLGRWVSCDPIGIGDGSNVYEYIHGHVIQATDPSGTQEKKYPPNEDPLDAGAPLPPPQPDYVDEGGEKVYLMPSEQARKEHAESPTAGAPTQEIASQGIAATTTNTKVRDFIRQEVVTGQKAALRSNPLVMLMLYNAFFWTLPFNKERAANILESVSGPEPRSEVAQGAELYTNLELSIGETFLFAGLGTTANRLRLHMPSSRQVTMSGGARTRSFLENDIDVGYGSNFTRIGDDPNTLAVTRSRKPWPGVHDVVVHAEGAGGRLSPGTPDSLDPNGFRVVETHEAQIAEAVLGNPNLRPGQPLRMLSCELCAEQAQAMANLTGRPVFASPLKVGVSNPGAGTPQTVDQFIRWDPVLREWSSTAPKQVWNLYTPRTAD